MKRIFALLIMALMVAILLPSCTENQRAKRFGGKMEYSVPKGERAVEAGRGTIEYKGRTISIM